MRATAFLAMAVMLAASAVGAAPQGSPGVSPLVAPKGRVARAVPSMRRELTTTSAAHLETAAAPAPWASSLEGIEVRNKNTDKHAAIRLYDAQGVLDRGQARAFMRIASRSAQAPDDASEDDERLDLRLVQLVVRASYHFGGASVAIVSATRPGARGKHGSGEALDFSLGGVRAAQLAAYLRTTPRAGVGIYTHPKTQYVHLDVRDHSYHWLDGSPPGVTWREQLLRDPKQAERDGLYAPSMDLPEPPAR